MPTPVPTATPASVSFSGTVRDFASNAPLAGMTVSVGGVPAAASCFTGQSNTAQPCALPVSPVSTTTAADGSFSLSGLSSGTVLVTVGPADGSYATLHRTVALAAGANTLTVKLTALSSSYRSWLADLNAQRMHVATPSSYGNLIVDEYAQEQAQKWADDVAAGTTAYGDAGYAAYQSAYASQPGALYAATGVLAVTGPGFPQGVITTDDGWMSEKANCPGGDWSACAFGPTTGHYINLSNKRDVFVGLGESAAQNASLGGYLTDVMIVQNGAGPAPAAVGRRPTTW
jgi:Carboxypeptidase regulatory-like domain